MMKIHYFGHDAFLLEEKGQSVLIDPFLSGNPNAKVKPSELSPKVILVTHGHGDHLGDAIDISKHSGAPILGVFELANYCAGKGAKTIGAHMGGTIKFDFGWVKLVPAWHSSSSPEGNYLGNPCGFVVHMGDTTVYHTGDTCLFGDMALIAEMTPIDVLLCPIGDHFTMGIRDAAKAVELVKPSLVIPMHYNTFEPIRQDPKVFRETVGKRHPAAQVLILEPGAVHEMVQVAKVS
ncbi:MAG: metal-dependent hydrolase [Candidatus Eremiobacteraeota bacterium]|nr:metal-dependent hydrolase [Candidatus Eremiobacteraeota bacterium]